MKIKDFLEISTFLNVMACVLCENKNMTIEEAILRQEEIDKNVTGNALSRRRRYLIYPEGSSLQLVHCLTYGSYFNLSDVFFFGVTLSMAWELPQDPYSPYDHHAEALHRNDDVKNIGSPTDIHNKYPLKPGKHYLVNKYSGKPIQPYAKNYFDKKYDWIYKKDPKKPKHTHKKINPVYAKRSIYKPEVAKKHKRKRASIMKIDRMAMHENQRDRKYLKTENMDWKNVEFHRISRSSLYLKLEKFYRGLGYDGRHCVLKALCDISQNKDTNQSSFLNEILRAVFTLHSGNEFKTKHIQAYDQAYSTMKNCTELYPKCITGNK